MEVRAFEHTFPGPSDRVDNVEYFQCNILNDDFSSELEGCCAVISALGIGFRPSTAIDPPPLYTEGTRKLVEAMSATGHSRIVVIRSEERSVGKECGSTCRSRGSRYQEKKKKRG